MRPFPAGFNQLTNFLRRRWQSRRDYPSRLCELTNAVSARLSAAMTLLASVRGTFEPTQDRYSAPDAFALTAHVVAKNAELCLETRWPDRGAGVLTGRAACIRRHTLRQ